MASKTFDVRHTRIKLKTNIIDVKVNPFNPNGVVASFEHNRVSGYYLKKDFIPYGVYLDRELYSEIFRTEAKIQLQQQGLVQDLEIYALPHFGYIVTRGFLQPGNKIRIQFRARSYENHDVKQFLVFYDNATGSIDSDEIGTVNAKTGKVAGRLLKSASIIG